MPASPDLGDGSERSYLRELLGPLQVATDKGGRIVSSFLLVIGVFLALTFFVSPWFLIGAVLFVAGGVAWVIGRIRL